MLFQVRVVVEIVWPLCLFLILVAVRTRPDLKQNKPECKTSKDAHAVVPPGKLKINVVVVGSCVYVWFLVECKCFFVCLSF